VLELGGAIRTESDCPVFADARLAADASEKQADSRRPQSGTQEISEQHGSDPVECAGGFEWL
jgi:hypothetical protein